MIFPVDCPICGDRYCSLKTISHCVFLANELKNAQDIQGICSELMSATVLAFREKGECYQEIVKMAYYLGWSTSNKEFKWLDEEIEKIKEEESNRKR